MKDADATVRHVSECSYRSDGEYWCPHCRRPERFVENDQGRENVPKTRLRKIDKSSAIKFFKSLFPTRAFKKTENRSDASETATSDVSSLELLSPQRANRQSLQEMFGSTPSDLVGRGSDTIYSKDHKAQMFVSPNGIFDDPVSTRGEFPCGDPVYYTTELGDRTSVNFASAQHATWSTTSSDLQAGSSHGRACPDTTIHSKKSIRDSRLVVNRLACSSSYDCCEEDADTCAGTPSLQHDVPVPQTTPPSTTSSSLISPLSSVPSSGSPASTLTSPMSNDGPGTSWAQVVPQSNTAAHIKDSNYALRPRSSTFVPADLEGTHSQGPRARANTVPTSDPSRCFGHSGSERRRLPFQVQNPSADADFSDGPYFSGPPAETRIQVQELLDLISIINKEWVEDLCRDYEVHRRCSSLSARSLLAKGINTLKTWFCGRKLGMTFEEVFSSMHIALAAAYYLHREEKSYWWDAFFQDALLFQHALIDEEEKKLFVMAIDRGRWLPDQRSTYISVLVCNDRWQKGGLNYVTAAKRSFYVFDVKKKSGISSGKLILM